MNDVGLLEATTAPAVPAVRRAKPSAVIDILDGDEIVQLSIKPSLWFIPAVALPTMLAMAIVGAIGVSLSVSAGWAHSGMMIFQVASLASCVRVAIASLQWASRLYVLTNRRVMCFRGVFSVYSAECRLDKISDVRLDSAWYLSALRVGSIVMSSLVVPRGDVSWTYVARPREVHELLLRAIHRAQGG